MLSRKPTIIRHSNRYSRIRAPRCSTSRGPMKRTTMLVSREFLLILIIWVQWIHCRSTISINRRGSSSGSYNSQWNRRLEKIAAGRSDDVLSRNPLVIFLSHFIDVEDSSKLRHITETHVSRLKANGKSKWCFSGHFVDLASDILGSRTWGKRVGMGGEEAVTCANTRRARERLEASDLRASTGISITLIDHDESVVNKIDKLLETEFGLERKFGAPGQFLYYPEGSAYGAHVDCFSGHDVATGTVNDRIVSVIIYLSSSETDQDGGKRSGGGETVFPALNLTIVPTEGSVLMWSSLGSDGSSCLSNTTHFSSRVRKGAKYAYQKWYHVRSDHGASSKLAQAMEMYRSLKQVGGSAPAGMPSLYDRTVFCEGEVGSCREYTAVLFPENTKKTGARKGHSGL